LAFGVLAGGLHPGQGPEAKSTPARGPDSLEQLKQRRMVEQYGAAQKELIRVQLELRRLQAEVESMQARPPKDPEPQSAAVAELVAKDPDIAHLEAQRRGLAQTMEKMLMQSVGGENLPTIQNYRQRLAEIEQQRADREKQLRAALVKGLREEHMAASRAPLVQKQEQMDVLRRYERLLVQDLQQLEGGQKNPADIGVVLPRLQELEKEVKELQQALQDVKEQLRRANKKDL
jgi:hypothetical protein